MTSIHDHNINHIEIKCGIGEVLFHTNLVNAEQSNEKQVKFIGVIGHKFEHILQGNIVFDIIVEDPNEFFKNNKNDLQEYQKFGFSLNCSNQEHFINSLKLNSVSIFSINPSYGLSGWIIAKEMLITDKL